MQGVLKKSDVLISFREDLLARSAADWFTSHISFMLPPHKFHGKLLLRRDSLVLEYENMQLVIARTDIRDLYLGFDNVFTPGLDRSRGLGFKPLKISFTDGNDVYLITDFSRLTRSSNNREWFDLLVKWLEIS